MLGISYHTLQAYLQYRLDDSKRVQAAPSCRAFRTVEADQEEETAALG